MVYYYLSILNCFIYYDLGCRPVFGSLIAMTIGLEPFIGLKIVAVLLAVGGAMLMTYVHHFLLLYGCFICETGVVCRLWCETEEVIVHS